jgi:hypothetical protein
MHLVFKPEKSQNFSPSLRVILAVTVYAFRQAQIAFGRQGREKIEALENETYLAATNVGALGVRSGCQILVVNDDAPARRR